MSRSITVLYGSETGNSQDLAESLSTSLQRHHYEVTLTTLDQFDITQIINIEKLIVICSTTGQGEFPLNARNFWKFMLKKKLPSNFLTGLQFTTFGLGDSSYPRFNWAIKKLHNRFLQLGATELSKRAEADEQSSQGIDGFYVEFEKLLLANLQKLMPLPSHLKPLDENELLPPKVKVCIDMKKPKRMVSYEQSLLRSDLDIKTAQVICNKRITSLDHFQDTRQLILKLSEQDIQSYGPGDTLALYPVNNNAHVNALLQILDLEDIADRQVTLSDYSGLSHDGGLVQKLTVRSLITNHLDINSIPRRSFFSLLYKFTTDERERDKLRDFSKFTDPEELYNYANRPRRSILEVLQEFDSVSVPLEYLFDLIPLIKPRLFSISSGDVDRKRGEIELTIGLVEYQTKIKRIRKGLCSTFVKSLNEGDQVLYKLSTGKLVQRIREGVPVIMVSPGTGLAPMKNLIESFVENKGYDASKLYLFFGNRYHNKDYYYQTELETYKQENKLQLFTSFSREAQGYVQDNLYAHSKLIADLLTKQNSLIFICGSSGSMPTQVRITFETILKEELKLDDLMAKKYMEELEQSGRYIQETW